MNLKKCSKCQQELLFENFNKCKNGKFGLHNHCRDCQKITRRKWYEANLESEKLKSREYAKTDKGKEQSKKHYQKNKEKILQKNKERRRTKHAKTLANKQRKRMLETNVAFKLGQNLRIRLRKAILAQVQNKKEKTFELLGCSLSYFKLYLESKFTEGMSWDNYGYYGWHMDHIIPCSKFDLTKEEDRRKCFHYTNIQPLWCLDNISKGNKTN